ncbi:MAG: flagellar biosynthesis anti-sigma factor FlgM [Gammaproteobacteria bacterium]
MSRIQHTQKPTAANTLTPRASRQGAASGVTTPGGAGTQGAVVTLDPRMQALHALAMSAPHVDDTRVEMFRSQVGRGAYRVDPGAIAERLLAFERGLVDSPRDA